MAGFHGNDGERGSAKSPSFPRKPAKAGGSVPAVAQGTSGALERAERPLPSFPRKRESTSLRRAIHGLTLIEMLVVLVLVSLLGTLLVQGAGFFLGRYASVQRVHRDASLAELRQHWFVSTLQAMVPSRLEARRFAGDAASFEGVTLQALAAEAGVPVRVRWSIDADRGASTVLYAEEGAAPWAVLSSDAGALAFQYADGTRRWHGQWPVEEDALERIPRMVRLVADGDRVLWLARLALFPEPVPNYREEF